MKVYNDTVHSTNRLAKVLETYRTKRAFDAESWVNKKVQLINSYFTQSKLSGAVIGVSGGIDSAVALSLVSLASKQENSPIKKIVPVLLPAFDFEGATNQSGATVQAEELCKNLNLKPALFKELTRLSQIITNELEDILELPSSDWARGQLVAYTRTPVLYNTCSILTDNGYPSLVIGTTNLSEGGYLGYVGKASDGMVDLQVISDLYKSEVYQVAKLLNVPQNIMEATPTGDMFDGREDEAVFGASYGLVELFHLWLQNGSDAELMKDETFQQAAENLEKLHKYNQHKYTYSTPSIHLDILPASIPGGWNNTPWKEN